jgi:hypothetical protein
MYTIYDSLTETLIEVFNDYESAQMFLLHISDEVADGGANLTIEAITPAREWAQDNNITLAALA